jgi:hypothetical protein
MNDFDMPDEPTALGMLLSEEPTVEARLQAFPVRRVVLAVIFGATGEVTIPLFADQARAFADTLIELADQLEAEGSGGQN